jgi:TonB family protein
MHRCGPTLLLFVFFLGVQAILAQESSAPAPIKKDTSPVPTPPLPLDLWEPITVKDGNFSALFPANKREGSRSRFQMQDGSAIETRFTAPTTIGNYQVAYTFLSENIATPQAVRQRFAALAQSLKTNPKAKWLGGGEIEYRGNPGIELKVLLPEGKTILWSRQYFAFGCIYELTVRYPFQEAEPKEAKNFLDSFNLLGPPSQRPVFATTTQPSLPDFTPLAQNTYYVSPEKLRAQAIEKPEPKFEIEGSIYSGTITLLVTVSPEGKVIQADPADGSSAFSKEAIKAVKKWSFKPFVLKGNPVKVQGRLTFKIGDAASQ